MTERKDIKPIWTYVEEMFEKMRADGYLVEPAKVHIKGLANLQLRTTITFKTGELVEKQLRKKPVDIREQYRVVNLK